MMKYRSYDAYTGRNTDSYSETVDSILDGINRRKEEIISVSPIREGYSVLIITLGQDDAT